MAPPAVPPRGDRSLIVPDDVCVLALPAGRARVVGRTPNAKTLLGAQDRHLLGSVLDDALTPEFAHAVRAALAGESTTVVLNDRATYAVYAIAAGALRLVTFESDDRNERPLPAALRTCNEQMSRLRSRPTLFATGLDLFLDTFGFEQALLVREAAESVASTVASHDLRAEPEDELPTTVVAEQGAPLLRASELPAGGGFSTPLLVASVARSLETLLLTNDAPALTTPATGPFLPSVAFAESLARRGIGAYARVPLLGGEHDRDGRTLVLHLLARGPLPIGMTTRRKFESVVAAFANALLDATRPTTPPARERAATPAARAATSESPLGEAPNRRTSATPKRRDARADSTPAPAPVRRRSDAGVLGVRDESPTSARSGRIDPRSELESETDPIPAVVLETPATAPLGQPLVVAPVLPLVAPIAVIPVMETPGPETRATHETKQLRSPAKAPEIAPKIEPTPEPLSVPPASGIAPRNPTPASLPPPGNLRTPAPGQPRATMAFASPFSDHERPEVIPVTIPVTHPSPLPYVRAQGPVRRDTAIPPSFPVAPTGPGMATERATTNLKRPTAARADATQEAPNEEPKRRPSVSMVVGPPSSAEPGTALILVRDAALRAHAADVVRGATWTPIIAGDAAQAIDLVEYLAVDVWIVDGTLSDEDRDAVLGALAARVGRLAVLRLVDAHDEPRPWPSAVPQLTLAAPWERAAFASALRRARGSGWSETA